MARANNKELRLGSRTKTANNRRQARATFSDALHIARDRARARTRVNSRVDPGNSKSVQAYVTGAAEFDETPGMILRGVRWLTALALLPFCWVTTITFFDQFAGAARQGFWMRSEFWYFATGVLLMAGWFFSGLLRNTFLYLYVLGHELTHIVFIWLFQGRVSDWGVSVEGGYVTTDKSNIIIALAPYFVPLWAALGVTLYNGIGCFWAMPPPADKVLFATTGFLWAFHLLWTLWMIPRDQPDLKENGTFLSLTIIYLANVLLLAALVCMASGAAGFRAFALDWVVNLTRLSDDARNWLSLLRHS